MLSQLLSVHKRISCLAPAQYSVWSFIKSANEAIAISMNWFRTIVPLAAVS